MTAPMRAKIEIFSAGCPTCREGIRTVQELVGKDHDITIHDMHNDRSAPDRAKELGVHRLPAVVVNGKLAQCCQLKPVDSGVIRSLLHTTS